MRLPFPAAKCGSPAPCPWQNVKGSGCVSPLLETSVTRLSGVPSLCRELAQQPVQARCPTGGTEPRRAVADRCTGYQCGREDFWIFGPRALRSHRAAKIHMAHAPWDVRSAPDPRRATPHLPSREDR